MTALQDKEVFSANEVAQLCGVGPGTAVRWIDSGKLRGYRMPGGRNRRVTRASLLHFLRASGLPVPPELLGRVRLLLVGGGWKVNPANLGLPEDACDMQTAPTAFDAGFAVGTYRPCGVIIDLAMGRVEATAIVTAIRRLPGQAETLIVGLVDGTDPDTTRLEGVGFTVLVPRDDDVAGVIRSAIELCGGMVEPKG